MHFLAQRLLSHIRLQGLLHPGERVGVAVSGGIDSVALLRLMLEVRGELGLVLSLVHFNHKLRGAESEGDQEFVRGLARDHRLEFVSDSDDVAGHAASERVSLETAARELRYGFFRHLLREGMPQVEATSDEGCSGHSHGAAPSAMGQNQEVEARITQAERQEWATPLDKILTGHTLDDQAETVLMRLIRGSGIKGLVAIHPRIAVDDEDGEICGEIIRPLLGIRRQDLESYLREVGQGWREDATNTDESFTRNRVRKLLVPLLEKEFNPAIAESLSELAEIARGEEDYWENEVAGWMGTGVHWLEPSWVRARSKRAGLVQIVSHPSPDAEALEKKIANAPWGVMNASIDRRWFLGEPVAVQRRVIKAIGEEARIPIEFKHVEEILRFASEESGSTGKELSLPLDWKIVRHADELLFVTPDLRNPPLPTDYECSLPIPGRVEVYEGFTIEARSVPASDVAEYNPDDLLDADSVTGPFQVRNWRAGDRFWPAHTKSPKKIKELLQERHVSQPDRGHWPVALSQNEVVWVRGFATHAKHRPKPGRDAILIRVEDRQNGLKVQD